VPRLVGAVGGDPNVVVLFGRVLVVVVVRRVLVLVRRRRLVELMGSHSAKNLV